MNKVNYEMQVPKEGKELVDLLEKLANMLMDKKPLAEYTALMPELMQAADGITQIDDELKGDGRDELAGYLVHKLMGALWRVEPKQGE